MPNLPYIPVPVSPETSVHAASAGAQMGNLAADNRLRAAQLAQQAIQQSQAFALSRMAQEAETAIASEKVEVAREEIAQKAEQAASEFQQRLTLEQIHAKGAKEIAVLRGEYGLKEIETKARVSLELNDAKRHEIMASLEGVEGADPNLLLDPKRKAAAEKTLFNLKMKETGLSNKLAWMRAQEKNFTGPELQKAQLDYNAVAAQREYTERALGRGKKGEQPSIITAEGKRIFYQSESERDAAVETMKLAGPGPVRTATGTAPMLKFNIRENRYD